MYKLTNIQKIYNKLEVGKEYAFICGDIYSSYLPALKYFICLEKMWCSNTEMLLTIDYLKYRKLNKRVTQQYRFGLMEQVFLDKNKSLKVYKQMLTRSIELNNAKIEIIKSNIKNATNRLKEIKNGQNN